MAVDANGNPVDTDGDGEPDYVTDANGNGSTDSGELNWALKVFITRPRASSPIPYPLRPEADKDLKLT